MTDTKKDFSNWLVASDIDGTLNDKSRNLPKRNYDAIQKFVHELGGHFTLASGRTPQAMRDQMKKINVPNSVVIALNGGCIYDFSKEEMLWSLPLSEQNLDVEKQALAKFKLVSAQIITATTIYVLRPTLSSMIYAKTQQMPIKIIKNPNEVKEPWLKIVHTGNPLSIKKMYKFLVNLSPTEENLMLTSVVSFDMVAEGTNKGKAVMMLAKELGVNQENTAAIGDYFNDYEMLKTVAFPACCGQAPQGMKDISKLVTCHCNNGAVADLLEYIIKNYNN